jgi:hypothetical protein
VFGDFCNVAPNPSFESSPESAYYSVGGAAFRWAGDVSHSGTHSLEIVSTNAGLSRWVSRVTALPLSPQVLTVSVFLKTDQVDGGYAGLTLTYWTAAGTYIPDSAVDSSIMTGTQDWTPVVLGVLPPPGAAFVRVEFRLKGPGTLWIDDLDVEQRFGA